MQLAGGRWQLAVGSLIRNLIVNELHYANMVRYQFKKHLGLNTAGAPTKLNRLF